MPGISALESYAPFKMTTTHRPAVEAVAIPPLDVLELPGASREMLSVDVIHDGDYLPPEFLIDRDGNPIRDATLEPSYISERDWGASLVAERMCARLGLPSYTRINIARVLMDFGRFPGSTPRHAEHLDRFAINYPFSDLLSFRQKKRVLEEYYDGISTHMERSLQGKLIKIAIHTYDQYNESGTERPAMSLMTRALAYQTSSELPSGLFDPLYPDILAEFTADRILRDRVSLTLEKALVPVAHNYPYCLPEGSLEVRYQVWSYFNALREVFEQKHPEAIGDEAFAMVWRMLHDTNLRSSESDALRSYIHMYRHAPKGQEGLFERAGNAYEALCTFCVGQGADFIDRYRFSPARASSLALEVRKDIIMKLDHDGRPYGIREQNINLIGDTLAKALHIYLTEDRVAHEQSPLEFERRGAWYGNPYGE